MLVFGKCGFILLKFLFSGKLVVIGQSGFFRANVVLFGQGSCHQVEVVVFGERWLYSG